MHNKSTRPNERETINSRGHCSIVPKNVWHGIIFYSKERTT